MRCVPFVATATLGVLAFASPGLAAPAEFWSPFTGPDGATIEKMVAEYNATTGKQKNATVELLIVPWDQYYTKLTVALASRRAPDLAIAHSHRIAGFVKQDALEPFTPDALARTGIDGKDYLEVLWNAGEISGKRYAVPIDAFPRNIYWNKKLFRQAGLDPDKAPATRAELMAAAEKITKLGPDVKGVFFRLGSAGVARDFYNVYWQHTDDLLAADRKGVAPGFREAATKAIDTMKGFLDAGVAVPTDVAEYETLFARDRIGVAFSQITELPLFRDSGFDYGIGAIPTLGERPAVFALGHNFVIPKGTGEAERDAALTFIEWFGQHSIDWVAAGKVPASKTVLESAAFQKMPDQMIVAAQLPHMRLPPTIAQQPDIDRVIQENVEKVYAGRQTSAEAVDAMTKGIAAVLAK